MCSGLLQHAQQRASFILFLLFLWRIKDYWSFGFMLLGKHTFHWIDTILYQTFCQLRGQMFVSWWSSIVIFAKASTSSRNNRRKPPRYHSVNLGDERVTIVVTTVRLWSKHPSIGTSPEVPEVVSPSPPTSPGLLGRRAGGSRPKWKEEVGDSKKTRTSGKAQMDGRSHNKQTVVTIAKGSLPRLADQYLGGFFRLLLNIWLKVNHGTSSGYKCLPYALTKRLLQVSVWRFSRRFVCLMTWTQRFSSPLFLRGTTKRINDTLCWTCWSGLKCNSTETNSNSMRYLTQFPFYQNFYLVDQ